MTTDHVLQIGVLDGRKIVMPRGDFDAFPNDFGNRTREIVVDDPEHPYGPWAYRGPAYLAAKWLEPGSYWFNYVEDEGV